ncbi:hypothetical protein ACFLQ2_02890 [archaeon]
MAKKTCVAAVCHFEAAAMVLVLVSWLYIVLIYLDASAFGGPWFAWWGVFTVSLYYLFITRRDMKEALSRL